MNSWARSSRSAPRTRSSRSATGSSCRSRSFAGNAISAGAAISPSANAPTATRTSPTRCSATPPRGCSATRTSPAAIAGGQAEYVRVPYADVGPVKIPNGLTDEQVLFLGDIFPDRLAGGGAMRHRADRHGRDLGRGAGRPVLHPQRRAARRQAGGRDRPRARAARAWREAGGAITINFEEESVIERLNELTGGKGPEKCIDAVGMEAHATAPHRFDLRPRQAGRDARERPAARAARDDLCLPPGGTLSVPGVYGGLVDKIPFGALMNKGLTIRTGQTHVNRWTDDLLRRIEEGQIDPSFVITHRSRSRTARRCTRPSATRRTAASRSF